MSPEELERYLHEHIPLTKAMEVSVLVASAERVVLRAPLAPNINHRQTAFGGSIATLATLAGWSWLHVHAAGAGVRLVIQASHVEFLKPIEGVFEAICLKPSEEALATYEEILTRRGKGRIGLAVTVEYAGQVAATFRGTFVALRNDAP